EPVWRAIKDLYERVKGELPTANEARTEQLFIHPVLELLGHKDSYAVQPPVDSPEGMRRPDFAFFASREDREAAASSTGRREYFTKALAVGDAKQWDRSLDRKRKGTGDAFTNANPSYQIDYYLRATDRKWGLLINGRRWRLYHRDSSYRTDVFYEVDLVAILDSYDEAFTYFYAFFRKEGLTTGFLDQALAGSRKYAAKLGDELKENVYEALRLLAEGFLKCPHNELTEDDLEEIRANTFVLIYRILFLFYAEDRELLPMHNAVYRDSYSLRAWAREIANQLDEGRSFSPTAYHSWNKLNELFRIVNEGDTYLGVPPYNGGLFDPEKHPALARWKVGDQHLGQALDQLFRAKAAGRGGRGPVSYRDLDIRNLGSIYEGLLEHRLRLAHEDIAVTREKDREVFVPVAKLGDRRQLETYQAGEVYLETDKGERKATGSYYTPDYIVKYIVENTLGPLVAEKRKELEEERRDLEEKLKKSRGYDRDHYQRKLSELDQRLIQEILSIKVLDPAMGSGHFLVEAVDYLARELIKAFGETPEEMEEEEIRWARREVVERCIYGVDVNPLAVELAKLSLWIETVAKDRPLSFLDHHLRLGNSLIGAWVKDLGRLPSSGKKDKAVEIGEHVVGLFEGELKKRLPVVLGEVIELLRKPSDKVEDIRDKEAIYERILTLLQPFKEVANAWVSTYFGNEVDGTDYENTLLKLSDPPAVWESEVRTQPWFEKAQEVANERHFFHWELEFPEVFFAETGQRKRNSGFDTVIGNPPYVRQEQLKDKDFFKDRFEAYDSIADLYVYFYEIGHRLLREGGRFGMITSNKFMRAAYGERLRRFIIEKAGPLQIIDFGDLPVFPDVLAYPCIVLTVKGGEGAPPTRYLRVVTLDFESLDELVQEKASVLPPGALTEESWQLAGADEMAILAKMEAMSVPLKDWLGDVEIRRGVLTGCNEAFFIDENTRARLIAEDPKSAEIIKPLVVGEDIERYEIDYKNRYLIFTRRGVDIDHYPAIKRHLEQFRERLEPRPRDWDEAMQGRWPGRKPGEYKWYEIQDSIDYYADFAKPKIIFGRFMDHPLFGFDPRGRFFTNDAMYVAAVTDGYPVTLLNSALGWLWIAHKCTDLRGRYLQVFIQDLNVFPIRRIAFTTPPAERARLVEEAKRLYRVTLERAEESRPVPALFSDLLVFVEECLKKVHQPDPELVRKHNADPLNKDWQIPEGALWEQSDVVHDLLAFLAEEMIRLNREKQAEMKSFLTWLEAELKVEPDNKGNTGIEALTGKARLKNYLGDHQKGEPEVPFDELWKILQKNKTRIGRKLTHEFMAELREAYERSLAKLRPIKECLCLTDKLIDRMVYRLYGLTEEEISQVKGKSESADDDKREVAGT
ncbi:MAG TPA: Eco57I restriction-modification methylase domain-containing protein, partial [Candidatus Bipolaricaulis sp.]|nr:Eco57I restriction-modification methylase domain-containing protein [Candidatus Bipolaricaulis sp.]